jgi:hypothetical protein
LGHLEPDLHSPPISPLESESESVVYGKLNMKCSMVIIYRPELQVRSAVDDFDIIVCMLHVE